ncbi:Na(+)-translocating NADH-quinone reductase subunit C [Biformimicrobium ophioploci]|uniref:Na(+)-translocating NADH-quinone reductase subunit C n=1 Tax=Biformimicrobium ophioploci TaxID=3036711 RepID=A0ABQ6M1M8_9GAMM|nr:Na(+)-translocating NADH-quinone reductase subunit C [Microbulbifer sp. NKW57]GMG88175.1 Na(+)-translocating NADH-quinone reductase subunit C [Microbulbifer sp. NKW57]
MFNKDSVKGTLLVALVVCLVCAVLVSGAAVGLKKRQVENVELDIKRNVLLAGGLIDAEEKNRKVIEEKFSSVETRVVDLKTGEFTDAVDAATFNGRAAAKDPALSEKLSSDADLAKIIRQEKYSQVYLVKGESGLEKVILPVRGYGLWGTLFGFLAVESDGQTIAGLGFYEHKETPGLGGEVDNPNWKNLWVGKKVYDEDGEVGIDVVKGSADPKGSKFAYQVDGLSGATLTSVGVENLVRFWLGDNGFGPFLKKLQAGEV